MAGHALKHALDIPLVCTFHTLARVKADTGDPEPARRIQAELDTIRCSDGILANSAAEADQLIHFYGADRHRIEIAPPGVDHAFFSPGDRRGARTALGLDPDRPVLLFVGRIQPLKGLDVAVGALEALRNREAVLVVVGGPSGPEGEAHEAACRRAVASGRPRPAGRVPSASTPPPAVELLPGRRRLPGPQSLGVLRAGGAGGGGLRHPGGGRRGRWAADPRRRPSHRACWWRSGPRPPSPRRWTASCPAPTWADALAGAAAAKARGYTWSTTAGRLRRLYSDLTARELIECGAVA